MTDQLPYRLALAPGGLGFYGSLLAFIVGPPLLVSTVTAVPAPGGELVTRGPYRRLRHPIYSAGLLMVPGAAALTDSAFVAGIGLVMLVVLDIRTRREERLLLERFGDAYRRHLDRTHRWLPRLRPGPAGAEGSRR